MKAFFIYLMIAFSVFEPFNIAGDSMEPTLSHGDVVVIDKNAYDDKEPLRGDVVIFYGTDEENKYFVKRIIGLPGETIKVKEGDLYLIQGTREIEIYEPYLPEGRRQYTLREIDGTSYQIPEGKYFVLGDNRDNSYDSRTWKSPFIPEENIVGKYYDMMPSL